jgi:hypothetical protein
MRSRASGCGSGFVALEAVATGEFLGGGEVLGEVPDAAAPPRQSSTAAITGQ